MSSEQHENGSPAAERPEAPAQTEHLNIKVTDNNNEVFFKIKKSTKLEKLMGAFCERQGKTVNSVRFLFEGQRVQPNDTPDTVSLPTPLFSLLLQHLDLATTSAHVAARPRVFANHTLLTLVFNSPARDARW